MFGKRAASTEVIPEEQAQLPLKGPVEYEALLSGLRHLEAALGSLRLGGVNNWRERADSELRTAATSIEHHCESAEAPDGLLTQVERDSGRSQNVSAAHRAHEQLCEQVEALVASLSQSVAIDVVCKRGTLLAKLLRRHLDLVGELAYDFALDSDTGVGD